MKPEKLLLLPPGKSLIDTVLHDEMAQAWAYLTTISDKHDFPRNAIGMVASSAHEGTTTITVALARYLVYGHNLNVCIVEANLRNPCLGRVLPRMKNDPGIQEVLAGKVQLEAALRVVDTAGLHLLSAGETTAQATIPEETALHQTIARLKELHDVVLLDCPPLGMAAESRYLLKKMDATFLVARAGRARLENVTQSLKTIKNLGKPLAGVILNNVINGLPGPLRSLF